MSVESFRGPGGATLSYRYDDFTDPWKDSPTVVLAHGFGRNSNMWYRWVPPLSAHFRVVRPDLRGWGLSKVPAGTYQNSLDALALDASTLLDHLRVEKAVWIGEATGALTGVMLSTLVPERLHALGVMGAPLKPDDLPGLHPSKDTPNWEALDFRESMDYMRTKGMRAWTRAILPESRWINEYSPEYLEWYVDQMAQEDPFLAAEFRRGMIEVNMIPRIKEIGVPVLWVEGSPNSGLLPEWRQVLENNPGIRLVQVQGSGSGIGYVNPEGCLAEVKSFLLELRIWPD